MQAYGRMTGLGLPSSPGGPAAALQCTCISQRDADGGGEGRDGLR